MMNYSISEIEEMLEKENFSTKMKAVVEILLSAINDWPDPIDNLYDYDLAVQKFIMNLTTKKNIELAVNKVDISKFAWEVESLSVLIEIYDYFDEDITLKQILDNIIKVQSAI